MEEWASQLVEIIRLGSDEGSLHTDQDYLIRRGNLRHDPYRMLLQQEDVLDYLEDLRASIVGSEPTSPDAMDKVTAAVTAMLAQPPPRKALQIDLVTSHRDIAGLPFEAALADGAEGKLLAACEPPVIITRRIRGDFREQTPSWPATPRVLVIGASPEREIPLEEHLAAMRAALRPWVEPLDGVPEAMPHVEKVMTTIPNASLQDIAAACRETDYTHVHVIAHGCRIRSGMREQFGLQLVADDRSGAVGVSGRDFARALDCAEEMPMVVTLTACDSANIGNPAINGASVAHGLHQVGIPVVVASQIPLSHKGSALTVETFYRDLLHGEDVRSALLATRRALQTDGAPHDWQGLVAYVQLPEGYQDRLLELRLKADLASMETASHWAEHLVKNGAAPEKYDYVIDQLAIRIKALRKRELEAERQGRRDLLEESSGLLGSAHKRLAELHYHRGDVDQSRAALAMAAEWYGRAYGRDPSSAWTGVQALSLEALTQGRIREGWRWHAAMYAARAEMDLPRPDKAVWGAGSVAELQLLRSFAGQPRNIDEVVAALTRLSALAGSDPFPRVATLRQLERYQRWWTNTNGFFPGRDDLREDVAEILRRWP